MKRRRIFTEANKVNEVEECKDNVCKIVLRALMCEVLSVVVHATI